MEDKGKRAVSEDVCNLIRGIKSCDRLELHLKEPLLVVPSFYGYNLIRNYGDENKEDDIIDCTEMSEFCFVDCVVGYYVGCRLTGPYGSENDFIRVSPFLAGREENDGKVSVRIPLNEVKYGRIFNS